MLLRSFQFGRPLLNFTVVPLYTSSVVLCKALINQALYWLTIKELSCIIIDLNASLYSMKHFPHLKAWRCILFCTSSKWGGFLSFLIWNKTKLTLVMPDIEAELGGSKLLELKKCEQRPWHSYLWLTQWVWHPGENNYFIYHEFEKLGFRTLCCFLM